MIADAREESAWVVAFDFSGNLGRPDRNVERPTLEEGFDEVNRVRRTKDGLRFCLFERRRPLRRFKTDENGNQVEVDAAPDQYMIERPGSSMCLLSRAAFEALRAADSAVCIP